MKKIWLFITITAFLLCLLSCSKTYTVTYNYTSTGNTVTETVERGLIEEPKSLERKGHTLDGWYYKNADGEEVKWDFSVDTVTSDITLEEKWTAVDYTITFDPNGGVCDTESLTVQIGEKYTLPIPTKEGQYFAGWYYGVQLKKDGVWTESSDMAYKAKWITYDPDQKIVLGTYEQDGDAENGKEPIEWVIIDEQDGQYLLMSLYALDVKNLDDERPSVFKKYSDCSLRKWLVDTFYEESFTDEEKELIVLTLQEDTDTEDPVFLLNIDEAEALISVSNHAYTVGTPYADEKGLEYSAMSGQNTKYWLRHGDTERVCYCYSGRSSGSTTSMLGSNGVRPVMWVDSAIAEANQ